MKATELVAGRLRRATPLQLFSGSACVRTEGGLASWRGADGSPRAWIGRPGGRSPRGTSGPLSCGPPSET